MIFNQGTTTAVLKNILQLQQQLKNQVDFLRNFC